MYCTGGTTGRPKGVLWRQSDTYVSSMVGADHESADRDPRQGAPQRGRAVVRGIAADACGGPVDGVLRDAGRTAGGALRRPDQVQPAPGVADRRAGEGRHDDDGRRRLRGTAGRGAQSHRLRVVVAVRHRNGRRRNQSQARERTAGEAAPADHHQRLRLVGDRQHGIRAQPARVAPGHLRSARGRHRGVRGLRPGSSNPASTEVGWVVRTGRIPLGYFDDADATRKTFPVVDGQRVVVSGDRASLEADGTLRLFGRDSLVVNTGGEKVFVEEVEAVLRRMPGGRRRAGGRAAKATGGGRRSWRWWRLAPDATVDARVTARGVHVDSLARFKAPKEFIFVDKVRRLGNGKADYRWAKSQATQRVTDMTRKGDRLPGQRALRRDRTATDLDAQGARRLLQGSGVDVRARRPVRAARRDGRAGRGQGDPDGQPRQAVGHRAQVRRVTTRPVRAGDGRRQPAASRCRRCAS